MADPNNPGGSPPQNPAASPTAGLATEETLQKILALSNEVEKQAERNVATAKAEILALTDKLRLLENANTAEEKYQALLFERQIYQAKIVEKENERITLANKVAEAEKRISDQVKAENIASDEEREKRKKDLLDKDEDFKSLKRVTNELEDQRNGLRRFNEANKVRFENTEAAARAEQRFGNLAENSYQMLLKQIGASTGLGDIVTAFAVGPLVGFIASMERVVSESMKLIDVVLKANQQFVASTGQIAQRTTTFGYGMSQFGIGFQQMNDAMKGLFLSMSGFTDQTQEVQEQLAASAAKMKNLGVDIATTGKNFDILTKSLKMSADSAMKAQNDIAKAAIAAGIAPSVMIGEFAANMPRLAGYGQQAVDIFIKLEKQAKSLGMTVQELNGIVGEQYDTFDGAAMGAGKLNAILGGNYLNSIQMMNANESERIMIIKRAVDASGLQIDGMHKFQQIAIANAMGIKDLSKLKNLLGKSTMDLTMDMEREAATQAKLEEAQKAAADMQQKMTTIFQAFLVVIRPLVYIIESFAKSITFVNDKLGLLAPVLWVGVTALVAFKVAAKATSFSLNLLKKAFTSLTTTGKIGLLITVLAILIPMLLDLSDAITKPRSPPLYLAIPLLAVAIYFLGEAVDKNLKTFIVLGITIVAIAVAVKLAASGLAELVKAFSGLTSTQAIAAFGAITAVMVGFTFALSLLAKVSAVAALPILAVGAGLLMMGGGIYLAATGMANLVSSIKELATGLTGEAVSNLYKLATGIGALILAFSGGGFGIISMGIGALALSAAIKTISGSINNINETKIGAFTSLLKTFAESLRLSGIETISVQIANAINNISAAIEKVPESKAVNFTSTMDSINRTFASVAQTDATKLESAKQFVDTATKYYTVQKDSKGADNDALVAALTKAIGGMSGGKGAGSGPDNIIIKLELQGEKIAEVVQKINERRPFTNINNRG